MNNEEKILDLLNKVAERLDGIDNRLNGIDDRLDSIETRLGTVESRVEDVAEELTSFHNDFLELERKNATKHFELMNEIKTTKNATKSNSFDIASLKGSVV